MKTGVVLLAGGIGSRMNASKNKILINIMGKTVLERSIEAFSGYVDEMIIVCRAVDIPFIRSHIEFSSYPFHIHLATGGSTRQESVRNGLLEYNSAQGDIVLIHDAARCLVDGDLISRVIQSVRNCGTGIPGIPATSTYKICDSESNIIQTPDRDFIYEIQTPQGFMADVVKTCIDQATQEGYVCTDDAGLLEHYHIPVKMVRGSLNNIKLTTREDLLRAETILSGGHTNMRVGFGYDVHRLISDRKLVLCGETIPFEYGLLGHSDADVAVHALMDAMLGACALGDIGKHFPDTDEKYKNISSLFLLKEVNSLLQQKGYSVNNADITIVAQKPKLLPYIPNMIRNICECLHLPENAVSVKATTTEQLGFEGRMEGISSYAVCTVRGSVY